MRPATISWMGYGWETAYAAQSATVDKAFGQGVKITNLARKNNIEKIYSMGSRNAQKLIAKNFEGAITVEGVLANPWFFDGLIGTGATTSSAPYVHTFTEDDTLRSLSIANNINTTTPSVAYMLGAKFGNTNIAASVGGLATVKHDMLYANEAFTSTTSSKVTDTFDCYTFAHGTLELPDGTTLAQVQNFDLAIGNSPELILGMGSRFAQEQISLLREYTGNISMAMQQSSDLLQQFYGGSDGPVDDPDEVASLQLTFTNGSTGTATRSIEMTYTGVAIDEDSIPQDPSSVIFEDVNLQMRSLTVVAENNTAAIP